MLSVGGIEVVLDAIVRPTWQLFRNICPLVSQLLVEIKYFLFFLSIDRIFVDIWIQVIVPSKKPGVRALV